MSEQPQAGTGQVHGPPVVYLPVEMDEHGGVAEFKMIRLGDGRIALLGYTALDRFIDCWGEHQPWLLFDSHRLDEIHAVKPFDVKLLDVSVPEEFRPGPVQDVRG